MRSQGKITHWNQQKAYGFITPASGEKRVFVHVRAFMQKGHQPEVDQRVTFQMATDRQGRPCAALVDLLGRRLQPGSGAMTGIGFRHSMYAVIIYLILESEK